MHRLARLLSCPELLLQQATADGWATRKFEPAAGIPPSRHGSRPHEVSKRLRERRELLERPEVSNPREPEVSNRWGLMKFS